MEGIDDFIARCSLLAKKYKFRDGADTEKRLIKEVVTWIKYPELQKKLLAKREEQTLPEALNICRVHEASRGHIKKLTEIQDGKYQEMDILKYSHWKRCGSTHSHQKKGVLHEVIYFYHVDRRTTGQKSTIIDTKEQRKTHKMHIKQKGPTFKPGHRKTLKNHQHRHQDRKRSNHVYAVTAFQGDRDKLYEQFGANVVWYISAAG